jgi:tetratricopeptide (TPR) repeat protein
MQSTSQSFPNQQQSVPASKHQALLTATAGQWLEIAYQYFQGDQIDQALEAANWSLAVDIRQAEAWNVRGVALNLLNQWDSAMEAYDEALAIDHRFEQAWFNRGVLFQERGAWARAIVCYRQVLRLNPEAHGAEKQLAKLESGLGLHNRVDDRPVKPMLLSA